MGVRARRRFAASLHPDPDRSHVADGSDPRICGLLGAAGLGAVGAGLGGASLASVRSKQEEKAFGGMGSSAEQFLGVRTRKMTELSVRDRGRIFKALGPQKPEWFTDPANQVIISSIFF